MPLDGLGLPSGETNRQGRTGFLRLVEHDSLEQARAFLTDLRINRKVSDRELTIQTKDGPLNIVFAGLKTGSQFVIVAARTAETREKLFAYALAQAGPPPEEKNLASLPGSFGLGLKRSNQKPPRRNLRPVLRLKL